MTGAPMPYGADAMVTEEDSVIDGNFVIINGPARREYVRKCGENISIGQKSFWTSVKRKIIDNKFWILEKIEFRTYCDVT